MPVPPPDPLLLVDHAAQAAVAARGAVDAALDLARRARREAERTAGDERDRALRAEQDALSLARTLHQHSVRLEVAAILLRDPVPQDAHS
jgi:hypothetical protein